MKTTNSIPRKVVDSPHMFMSFFAIWTTFLYFTISSLGVFVLFILLILLLYLDALPTSYDIYKKKNWGKLKSMSLDMKTFL